MSFCWMNAVFAKKYYGKANYGPRGTDDSAEGTAGRLHRRGRCGEQGGNSRQESPGHLEACAYELARFYNILEKMLERICDGFENHLEKRGDYHERLLQRLNLELKG